MNKSDQNNKHILEEALSPELKEVWDMAGRIRNEFPVSKQETEEALKIVLERLPHNPIRVSPLKRFIQFAVAATVLIAAVTSYLTLYEHTYLTPAGEQQMITLSDGSVVWLNGNSRISHTPLFGITHRNLSMSGEVYFEVIKDAKPFVVQGPHLTTTVLGTAFSIKDWNEMNALKPTVTVTEGIVSVSDPESENHILEIADRLELDPVSGAIHTSNTGEIPADWRDNGFIFHSTLLPEFFERLQYHYNTPISVSAELDSQRIEAHYRHGKTLEQILSDVAVVKDLKITKTNNGYVIRP